MAPVINKKLAVCSLFLFDFFYENVYHTSQQNIQILVDMVLKYFSDFQGIKRCIINHGIDRRNHNPFDNNIYCHVDQI